MAAKHKQPNAWREKGHGFDFLPMDAAGSHRPEEQVLYRLLRCVFWEALRSWQRRVSEIQNNPKRQRFMEACFCWRELLLSSKERTAMLPSSKRSVPSLTGHLKSCLAAWIGAVLPTRLPLNMNHEKARGL